MIHLETDRLKFRQWQEHDFESFSAFFSDEESARFVGGKKSREQAWRLMAAYVGHYHLKGFGYLAIEEKASGKLAGCTGLWKSEPWPELELGYWLLKPMQGKGFASEAALKVKEYAFHALGAESLVSYIDPANKPSVTLALRIGGLQEEEIELLDFGKHLVFRYSPDR